VLRLNGRELLFGEASVAIFSLVTALCRWQETHFDVRKPPRTSSRAAQALTIV